MLDVGIRRFHATIAKNSRIGIRADDRFFTCFLWRAHRAHQRKDRCSRHREHRLLGATASRGSRHSRSQINYRGVSRQIIPSSHQSPTLCL